MQSLEPNSLSLNPFPVSACLFYCSATLDNFHKLP